MMIRGIAGMLLAAALVAAAPSTAVRAADNPAAYQVEVIVFRNLPAGNAPARAPDAAEAAPSDLPAYPLLPAGSLGLSAVGQQLSRSGSYRPIAHLGWQQPAGSRASPALEIPADIAARTGLTGRFRLYRQGGLLLDVALSVPVVAPDGTRRDARISEVRRIRGSTLQYFDDAGFGVIARVTAVDPASATGR